MEKRVVIFLILSLAIIFSYDFLLKQLGLIPDAPALDQIFEEKVPSDGTAVTEPFSRGDAGEGGLPLGEEAGDQPTLEELADVETPLFHTQISNRGGVIRSWKLKHYLTQDPEDASPVELVYSEGNFPGPLSLYLPDPELTKLLREGLYDVQQDFTNLHDRHPTGHLTYTYRIPERGIWVQKELTFHHDSYLVDVTIKVQGIGDEVGVLLGTNFGVLLEPGGGPGQKFIGHNGPAWMIGDVLEKEDPDPDEPEIQRTGDIRWVALQDKYFISAIITEEATKVFAKTEAERVVTAGVGFPANRGTQPLSFGLYAGPKRFKTLKAFDIGLEDTIDFGWFIYGTWRIVEFVAKPLFYVLQFIYDYTQNFGVAIILLTCGIKLLFVPLQYKSYKSMQGMQKVQPKVAALQAKFKDDREKLNKELINLYKEHKVNPVGGCLPMLLQMPVFISLFNILYMTVEMRQAPFILWISDLSVPDPYYVFPILMGVSMVVQQKIMPTTMDPTQAKMMLMLPVFLTFLFLTFPAGLVLYWFTNNVLTIAQQFITDRFILKRPTFSQPTTQAEEPSPNAKEDGQGIGKIRRGKGRLKKSEKAEPRA
ncbi:MAG: membrane protein insertase YidC [Nitrospinae bacterium]|nr:membrane protein insertase YidC [Nitrospinota bacterium]